MKYTFFGLLFFLYLNTISKYSNKDSTGRKRDDEMKFKIL